MSRASRLGMGTALFGAGTDGADARARLSEAESFAAVAMAADAGLRLADTAAQWGGSEAALGAVLPRDPAFRIVTKTAPLSGGLEAVERRARASLSNLGVARGDAVLVHRAADLAGPDGVALWNRLKQLKDEGLFAKIGMVACACDDPVGLARRFKPDLMQLPASLLDQRMIVSGAVNEIALLGVEIHLRAAILRGPWFEREGELPPDLGAIAPTLSRLRSLLAESGMDPLQASLDFALGRPEASGVIVGVSSLAAWRVILAAATRPAQDIDWSAFACESVCQAQPRRCVAA